MRVRHCCWLGQGQGRTQDATNQHQQVWWGQWHEEASDKRYALTRQTSSYNQDDAAPVAHLEGYQLAPARIVLLYSRTTMSQALNDEHSYNTLLVYMLLVQCGYPVDILSEDRIARGLLQERHYQALGVMGGSALAVPVHEAIDRFVRVGGLVIQVTPILPLCLLCHARRDAALRNWFADTLADASILPRARSSHPNVEIALWRVPDQEVGMLFAANHPNEITETEIAVTGDNWIVRDALTGQDVDYRESFSITLKPFEGRAFRLTRT